MTKQTKTQTHGSVKYTVTVPQHMHKELNSHIKAYKETNISKVFQDALNSYLVNARINEVKRSHSRITQDQVPASTNPPYRNDGKDFVQPNGKWYPDNVTAPTSFGGPQTGGTFFIDAEAKQRMQAQEERNLRSQIIHCQDEYNQAEALYKQGKVDYQYWTAAQELYEASMMLLQAKLKALRGN
ncbi:MAG: ribbon-helix-helix domain-containing protein [Nitrososphaerota archaeon]|jgi:hypothetical protein|nr:ribbon-helix-helix domain-containing protein [Nitrososphaerota archaeon]